MLFSGYFFPKFSIVHALDYLSIYHIVLLTLLCFFLPCLALDFLCDTEFWLTSLPFSQGVVSKSEKLN